MLVDVTNIKLLGGYNMLLSFDNGQTGQVNIQDIIKFEGVFAPLKDYKYFAEVKVNHDIGTICWQNGADIAPDTLFAAIKTPHSLD